MPNGLEGCVQGGCHTGAGSSEDQLGQQSEQGDPQRIADLTVGSCDEAGGARALGRHSRHRKYDRAFQGPVYLRNRRLRQE